MARLTSKILLQWVKDEFVKLEITDIEPIEIVRTRYSIDQYEGGACRLHIRFADIGKQYEYGNLFMCFYPLKELQDHIDKGYEMYLTYRSKYCNSFLYRDLEIELRKK